MKQDYKTACLMYKIDSGEHHIKPVKSKSHYTRGAWHLLDRRGNVVAIVGEQGCLWGGRLAVYYHELSKRAS